MPYMEHISSFKKVSVLDYSLTIESGGGLSFEFSDNSCATLNNHIDSVGEIPLAFVLGCDEEYLLNIQDTGEIDNNESAEIGTRVVAVLDCPNESVFSTTDMDITVVVVTIDDGGA